MIGSNLTRSIDIKDNVWLRLRLTCCCRTTRHPFCCGLFRSAAVAVVAAVLVAAVVVDVAVFVCLFAGLISVAGCWKPFAAAAATIADLFIYLRGVS